MLRKSIFTRAAIAAWCMVCALSLFLLPTEKVQAGSGYAFVVLSTYEKTMEIGEEGYLVAVTSNGNKPTFSSSDSKVASVNTYGLVTAKKAGTAKITAKTKNGEASCKVTVKKTTIQLSAKSISLENGYTERLTATSSTGHALTFKSGKTSVASVSEKGVITAKKPGEAAITVSCDGTTATCKVTVREPRITLSRTSATLYRNGKLSLSVTSTSKSTPKWKSNKTSVATVDSNGNVTAVKHGSAVITVTVDGVSKTCQITVKQPTVNLDASTLELSPGQQKRVTATVSSGNQPTFSSSNTNVVTVTSKGLITARGTGKAYVYAQEDGVKAKVTVTVK